MPDSYCAGRRLAGPAADTVGVALRLILATTRIIKKESFIYELG
jgi:hypothetical protein